MTERRFFASEQRRSNTPRVIQVFGSRENRDRWVEDGDSDALPIRRIVRWRELSVSEKRLIDRQLEIPF